MHRPTDSGATLTEMLVALGIFGVVIAAAALFYTQQETISASATAASSSRQTIAAVLDTLRNAFSMRVTLAGTYAGFYASSADPCTFNIFQRRLDASGNSIYSQVEFSTVCAAAPAGMPAGLDLTSVAGGLCDYPTATQCAAAANCGGRLRVTMVTRDVGSNLGTNRDLTPVAKGSAQQAVSAAMCAKPSAGGTGTYPVTSGHVLIEVAAARLGASQKLVWDRVRTALPVNDAAAPYIEILRQ